MLKKLTAEGLGALFLTAVICLAAVAFGRGSGSAPTALILALAAGFALTGIYSAFGAISDGHFNPAVSVSALVLRQITAKTTVLYVIAQTLGGALGGLAAFLILSQQPGFQPLDFGSNGYGAHSPVKAGAAAVFAAEALLSLLFVLSFLRAQGEHRALVIGLTFAGCCLAVYGLSGAGLNPARSTGAALFAEGWAISQLWLFWIAPMLGGMGAGLLDKWLYRDHGD